MDTKPLEISEAYRSGEPPSALLAVIKDDRLNVKTFEVNNRSKHGILFTNHLPWNLERIWFADVWYGKIPFCKTLLLINVIIWVLSKWG
ncbi:hypothetical protein LCGC14_0642050 [marine sediment metagenome]|uniref:Uncharacterized protein n=1 Tax=marine sediment metagenome TaxID=412755 RepID=A0A0F9U781_9ZZZZ